MYFLIYYSDVLYLTFDLSDIKMTRRRGSMRITSLLLMIALMTNVLFAQGAYKGPISVKQSESETMADTTAVGTKNVSSDFALGLNAGKWDGGRVNTNAVSARGFFAGVFLTIPGWLLAGLTPGPAKIPVNLSGSADYRNGYIQGFEQKSKSKKRSDAFRASIIGTGAVLSAFLVMAIAFSGPTPNPKF